MDFHPDTDDHVAHCADCQAQTILRALDVDLERVWSGIAAEVWAREVGLVERWATHLLRSPGLARALVTTPSLVPAWILATVVVLAAGVVFTWNTGTPWVALLAPALAAVGIAYAYGPGVDPAFELGRSMPISDRMILLVRGLAVFGLNALLGLAASLIAGGLTPLTFSWLIPMTTVCALALATALLARSPNVGVTVGLTSWALVVLGGKTATEQWATAVAEASLIPIYLISALVLVAVALYASNGKREEMVLWQ
ncbi:MAG: hypothetical protein M3220_19855 [Chloroflexota bacterium]|nr:hypothetical protein [Chloroflexota bacterium]